MKLLGLLTKNYNWVLCSFIIKYILILFYKFEIGKNFYIQGFPSLKLLGKNKILIGDNVKILGDIDFRTRESGRLIISNNVKIEENCRFVVAKEGTTKIGDGTVIGCNAIWNGGGNITVGKNCIFSARSSLNANEHNFNKEKSGKELFFNYGDITIADECFIGINSSIALNTSIGKGAVVGAHSFVNSNINEYSINVGSPTKQIKLR